MNIPKAVLGTTQSKAIRTQIVADAIAAVRLAAPTFSEDAYKRAESRLKTSIKRVRRGNRVEYTLSVPEYNLTFTHTETLNTGIFVSKSERNTMMALPIDQLRAEVKAAWTAACVADKIPIDAMFAAFSNTVEDAVYNQMVGILQARLNNQGAR